MRFVSVRNMARWIGATGHERIISALVDDLEADFRRWPEFTKSPRFAAHSPLGVIELMPANDREHYAFKYVNGHPSNPGRGLQTVTAFGVLADLDSGYPVFISEMTLLTALRTAAVTGLAVRHLAPVGATRAAFIGAGSQSEFQALAVRAETGIDQIAVFDVDPHAGHKLRGNLAPLGFEVRVAASAEDAVLGADIITTCTADKANAVVLDDAAVRPGVLVNGIGGDCPGKTELDPRTVQRARVVVEFEPQTRIEGEIQNMAPDFPVTELWTLLDSPGAARARPDEVVVFDSVGFAVEDFTALRHVARAVLGTPFEEHIDLVAEPDDPRDLFGMLPAPMPVA
ncbi:ornithine cyclodeaminase [Nocardioides hwasunensis]|uniref:Ornithine cyclodeaminase n=1 Tax=Nocardioides hwasunensis TaxID=397258 RepID=A0ABR8MJV8_9ACTN|nr:ornithine cyclodeaminase [Nocardioides hwasunensis]MBD3915571.1 ornithine cyclodeaminase [Nocardioides hwasunensis]